MPSVKRQIATSYLKERLNYDPQTGLFTWKPVKVETVQHTRWNSKWAGKVAGTTCAQGYTIIAIDNVQYRAHRLAWAYVYGEAADSYIDHTDGNRTNNRIKNLRAATHAENLWNRAASKNSKTGVKGVMPDKKGTFRAEICANGKRKYIGRFKTIDEAASAYAAECIKRHGEFSNSG